MQPVRVISKPVEVSKRRGAVRLIVAQAGTVRMKVPLQRPGAHGQAGTCLLAMAVAHGIQDAIQMIMQPIYRIGRACGLRTVVSRRKVVMLAGHLSYGLSQRSVEGGTGPLAQAAQTLSELRFVHGLIGSCPRIPVKRGSGREALLG